MSLTDASGLSASDVLALTANNNDGFGGNWGNAGGNGVANMAVPYMIEQNK